MNQNLQPDLEELLCSLCLEFFKDPRVLNCKHTFCQECLAATTNSARPMPPSLEAWQSQKESAVEGLSAKEHTQTAGSEKSRTSSSDGKSLTFITCAVCFQTTPITRDAGILPSASAHVVNAADKMRKLAGKRGELGGKEAETPPQPVVPEGTTRARMRLCQARLQAALRTMAEAEGAARQKEASVEAEMRIRVDALTRSMLEARVRSLVSLDKHSKRALATYTAQQQVLHEKLASLDQLLQDQSQGHSGNKSVPGTTGSEDRKTRFLQAEPGQQDMKKHLLRLMSTLTPVTSENDVSLTWAVHWEDALEELFSSDSMSRFIGCAVEGLRVKNLVAAGSVALVLNCCPAGDATISDVCSICPETSGTRSCSRRVWVAYGFKTRRTGRYVSEATVLPALQKENTSFKVGLFFRGGQEVIGQDMPSRPCVAGAKGPWVIAEVRDSKAWFLTADTCWEWLYSGTPKELRLYNKGPARAYLCVHRPDRQTQGMRVDLRSVELKEAEGAGRAQQPPKISGSKMVDIVLNRLPIAMDLSQDGQILAVIEESMDEVLFFHNPWAEAPPQNGKYNEQEREKVSPFAVYPTPATASSTRSPAGQDPVDQTSLSQPIKPQDVCFCFIPQAGFECLVVADWSNDALLVLRVNVGESCDLIGQIGAGSPFLVKPSALAVCATTKLERGGDDESEENTGGKNSDGGQDGQRKGCELWVGCRGGNILVVSLDS